MILDFAIPSAIRPKRPLRPAGWERVRHSNLVDTGFPIEAWRHKDGILVMSAVEVPTEQDGTTNGPEYHLSISMTSGQRIDSKGAKWVRRQFGLEDAKEDNHFPGVSRSFWRPVADHLSGIECKCVETEPKIVEDQGDFVWRG